MTAVQASLPNPASAPARSRTLLRTWFVPVAVGLSLATHLAVLGLFVLLQRHPGAASKPDTPAEVELLMVEQQGGVASEKGDQAQPADPAKPALKVSKAAPPKPPVEGKPAPAAPPAAPPLSVAGGDEPAPAEQAKPEAAEPEQAEAPPAQTASKGLVIDLQGTDSDTGAIAFGDRILPASPDDRFRNRPPPYPDDAARRGEEGDVVVTVHVSANGLAEGAEVESSSGSASLDRAAVNALRKWRFHPAMKDGQPVPFDFTINISFRP